jgi:hypothetical protein
MASATPYSVVPTMDLTKEGMFTSKTYHGLSILVGGNIIGRIQSWQVGARTRTVTHKWELSKDTFGRPVDLVPSKTDGYTISVSRIDVWNKELEIACGYDTVWSDLADQSYPFVFDERLYEGSELYRQWTYPSCWFTSYSEEAATSEGDAYYSISGEISYLPRTRVV